MRRFVKRQVWYIWIALIGVVFSALAPTVSHAMAGSLPSGGLAQVCTANGIKTIDTGVPGTSAPHPGGHLFEHCPYCATDNSTLALLPAAEFVFPVSSLWAAYPPLFYQSASLLFPWTAASPRAPPVLA